MGASASAQVYIGVSFDDICECFNYEKVFVTYDPKTGKPINNKYTQKGIKILGVQIPDDPEPDNEWQWVDRNHYRGQFWERGLTYESIISRYLLSKDWDTLYDEENGTSKLAITDIIGLKVADAYYRDDCQEIDLEEIQKLKEIMKSNLNKIGYDGPIGLWLNASLNG